MNIAKLIPGITSRAGDFGIFADSRENEERILIYQKTKDPALREEIILENLRLVLYIINRMRMKLPAAMAEEDVVGFGIIGLIGSIERYDVTKGHFTVFAYPRITGAIMDGIEDFSWFKRSDRRIFCTYLRSRASCERSLGRLPTDDEVAEEMGFYGARRERMMTVIRNETPVSLDEALEVSDDGVCAAPDELLLGEDARRTMRKKVEQLPEKERTVIFDHYYRGLSFRQTVAGRGMSASAVCRAHRRALDQLRAEIDPEEF